MDDRAQGEQVEAGDSYWSDWAREASSPTSRSDVDEEASDDINLLLVSEGHSLASSLGSGSDSGDVQMQTTNMSQHHSGLYGGISVSHSFPILTIRPPATGINSDGFPGVVTCGIAAADKESGGGTLCSKEEPLAVQSREKKLRFEATQVSYHLKRGDNLLEKLWLERDDYRSTEQGDADDILDPQWRTKFGHGVSDDIDSCDLPSERNHVSHSSLYFEQHGVADTSDKKSDDNMHVDSSSDVIHERIKRNVQSDLSTNCLGFEPHWPMQCSYEVGKRAPEKGQQLIEDVSKSRNIMIDSFNGLSRESFTSLRHGFNSPTSSHSLGKASTVLSRLCGADSVPTEQAHLVLKAMHSLSELFLFQCSNGPRDLKDEDFHTLKSVINNVSASLKHLQQGTERQQFPFSPPRPAQLFGNSTAQMKSGRSEEVQMRSVQANGQGQSTLPQVYEERIRYPVQGDPNKGDSVFVPSDDLDEVGNDKMTQAIKKILIDNLDDKVEPNLQIQFFKNLWLEAEATLYSMKFRSCFRRMKMEMERLKSFQRDSSDNVWEMEKSLSLNPSYSPAEEKSVLRARCHANQNATTQFFPALNAGTNINDVMARFNILKDRGFNSAGDEGKCVSPENSKVGHNTDDVVARFNILKGRDFNSNAMSAGDDVKCVSHVDFKSQNLVQDDASMTRTFPIGGFVEGNSDNFPVNIPSNRMDDVNASVVKRLSILRQRDDSLVSVNIQGRPKEAASLGSFLKKDYFSSLSEKTDVLSLRKSPAFVHYTASPADGMLTSKDVCTVLEDDKAPQSQCVGGSTNLNFARRSDNSPISSDWELCGEGDLSAEG